jgi:hypothetical protein
MTVKITGLNEVRDKLERLKRNVRNVSGPVAFEDLLPPEFMRRYTDFPTIEAMTAASGFKIESQEDFQAIPESDRDAYVQRCTRFNTWRDMLGKAAQEYAVRRLGADG